MKRRWIGSFFWQQLVAASVMVFIATAQQVDAQPLRAIPTLVICPPGDGIRELFLHPEEWSQARSHTGAILYADHNLTHFSDAELRTWFTMMRMWNISLELEVGAIKEWGPAADATFRAEQPLWDRVIRLGGDLASIVMDEPLAASRSLGHPTDAYAVEQTARFIALVRQRYPRMRIGDVEPYPSISLEDHIAWLKHLQAHLGEQKIASLDFYRADVDWVSFIKTNRGNWRDVASLAAVTRQSGLPFSLIYWASAYPSEKAKNLAGDDTWYVEVLGQGYAAADAGVHPDQFVLESWIGTPDRTVPDSANFTFTRSVLDFGRRFVDVDRPVRGTKSSQ